jgi:hypothetical protein
MIAAIVIGLLILLCAMLAVRVCALRKLLVDATAADLATEHNLRAIRAKVNFPEAVAVCDALDAARRLRGAVQIGALEQRLCAIRRGHNDLLLMDRPRQITRVRDMLHAIAVAAGTCGLRGIEAHALGAIAILRNGAEVDGLFKIDRPLRGIARFTIRSREGWPL